jgi:hypothetical protein
MLRPVALVRTDISEEPSASIIRVTRIGVTANVVPNSQILVTDVGGATLRGIVDSYKSYTA